MTCEEAVDQAYDYIDRLERENLILRRGLVEAIEELELEGLGCGRYYRGLLHVADEVV